MVIILIMFTLFIYVQLAQMHLSPSPCYIADFESLPTLHIIQVSPKLCIVNVNVHL